MQNEATCFIILNHDLSHVFPYRFFRYFHIFVTFFHIFPPGAGDTVFLGSAARAARVLSSGASTTVVEAPEASAVGDVATLCRKCAM